MSKYNREKHKKIINLIEEAAFATARLLQEGRVVEVPQLLADCQDVAVALGTHIEKLYGMQTQTVATLEQYCNALYQVSVDMDEASLIALAESIEQIQSVYNAEFPEKKEVVFMPYNASMWDSLESVWMAARDDESCEAYVVPIPYYDLDENRCFKEFHYEGDKFPEYVPITHYEDYDLELHHPDMIFIHNPYDECNLVTSMAPEYYSSRIKEFTDCLVYIPYFVLAEISPKHQAAIEGMKHFCTLPGVIHADKVIVQSEDMRQIYINEYMKAVGAAGGEISRKELEEKILGLGSPKLDKAVNTKKEDIDIPSDWRRIIEKPDGTWKKIIFYNTSIGAFLNDSERMLIKIEQVLRAFKKDQEDVALLWRPHPLMLQTIESMRPHLREKYQEIVQQYREEGWGIYDNTTDMNRAVVLSDAYYGDPSSVLNVYEKLNKPIMRKNAYSVLENNYSFAMENIVEYEDKWWFLATKDNALYCMKKDSLQASLVERFPWEEKTLTFMQYEKTIRYKDKLFLIPWMGTGVRVYDLKEEKTYVVSHEQIKRPLQIERIFSDSVVKGDNLYLISKTQGFVLSLNMETDTFCLFDDKKTTEILKKCEKFSLCSDEEGVWQVANDLSYVRYLCWKNNDKIYEYSLPEETLKQNFSVKKITVFRDQLTIYLREMPWIIVIDRNTKSVQLFDYSIIIKAEYSSDYWNDEFITYSWKINDEPVLISYKRGQVYSIIDEKAIYSKEKIVLLYDKDDEILALKNGTIAEAENRFDTITAFIKFCIVEGYSGDIVLTENGKTIFKDICERI